MFVRQKRLLLPLLGALAVAVDRMPAQPAQSVIQDIVTNADGSRFQGDVVISWNAFTSADGAPIAGNVLTVPISKGSLSLQLVPTTDVSGAHYRAIYRSNGTSMYREYWSVPPSSQALRLKDIRIPVPPTADPGGTPVPPAVNTQITIADVGSLQQELDARPAAQPSALRGRVTYFTTTGALDSVLGDPAECVRVDGSATACGSAAVATFVDGESPAGLLNGSNQTFTLASLPSPASSVRLYRNGVLLRAGPDYSVSGSTITFASGLAPSSGDVTAAIYRTSGANPSYVDGEAPTGIMNGSNSQFTLTSPPAPASSLELYKNGMLQRPVTDYTISGNVVLFTSGSIPHAGDTLVTFFRK